MDSEQREVETMETEWKKIAGVPHWQWRWTAADLEMQVRAYGRWHRISVSSTLGAPALATEVQRLEGVVAAMGGETVDANKLRKARAILQDQITPGAMVGLLSDLLLGDSEYDGPGPEDDTEVLSQRVYDLARARDDLYSRMAKLEAWQADLRQATVRQPVL